MTAPDRRSAAGIAADVNAGRSSAVAQAEETLARLAFYDAIQPQVWINRTTTRATSSGKRDRSASARIVANDCR